jgi:rod shape-determining protein MreC
MLKFIRNNRTLSIILGVVAALALMSVLSFFSSGKVSILTSMAGTALQPIQRLFSSGVNSVGDVYASIYQMEEVKAENAMLRMQIAQMEEELRNLEQAGEENERLRELLSIKESRPEFQFVSCSLLSRNPSNYARTFTLDKGTAQGVDVGDSVLSAQGYLVGVISESSLTFSTVCTLLDPSFRAGAYAFRNDEIVLAQGDFESMKRDRLRLKFLPLDTDVQIGDTLLTSGLGGVFPQDIPIGKVTDVTQESDGMSISAAVQPYVTLEDLTVCYVIADIAPLP